MSEVSELAPEGWPACLAWPPPKAMVEQAERDVMSTRRQLRLCGRPLLVLDGIALDLIVSLTGHRVDDAALSEHGSSEN